MARAISHISDICNLTNVKLYCVHTTGWSMVSLNTNRACSTVMTVHVWRWIVWINTLSPKIETTWWSTFRQSKCSEVFVKNDWTTNKLEQQLQATFHNYQAILLKYFIFFKGQPIHCLLPFFGEIPSLKFALFTSLIAFKSTIVSGVYFDEIFLCQYPPVRKF